MTPSMAITDARVGIGRREYAVPVEVRAELFSQVTALAVLRERIEETCARLDSCESRALALTARDVHATVAGAARQMWALFREVQ